MLLSVHVSGNLLVPAPCEHATVTPRSPVTVQDGPGFQGYFLRRIGVCCECGEKVVQVTPIMTFGPWRPERGVLKR